jgi:hypothetical protein
MSQDYTTTSLQLQEFAKELQLPLLAIVSKDELKGRVKVGSIILNLQSSTDGNGSHWTLLKVFPKGQVIYFDPFGFPYPKEVGKYIGHKMAVSTRDIQSPNSTMCGYFCLACDYYMTYETERRDIYQRYDDFMNKFKVDTTQNDDILKKYLESVGLQY